MNLRVYDVFKNLEFRNKCFDMLFKEFYALVFSQINLYWYNRYTIKTGSYFCVYWRPLGGSSTVVVVTKLSIVWNSHIIRKKLVKSWQCNIKEKRTSFIFNEFFRDACKCEMVVKFIKTTPVAREPRIIVLTLWTPTTIFRLPQITDFAKLI